MTVVVMRGTHGNAAVDGNGGGGGQAGIGIAAPAPAPSLSFMPKSRSAIRFPKTGRPLVGRIVYDEIGPILEFPAAMKFACEEVEFVEPENGDFLMQAVPGTKKKTEKKRHSENRP